MSILSIVIMFLFVIVFTAIVYLWVLIDDLSKVREWNIQQLHAEVERLKSRDEELKEEEREYGIRVVISRQRAIDILRAPVVPFHIDHLTSNETLAGEIASRRLYRGMHVQVIGEAPRS